MTAPNRLLGQECSIIIQVDGDIQTRIDSISSCEIELELELIENGFLGEKANRIDSVYNSSRIKIDGHCNSQAYFDLAEAIVARAQRRAGGAVRIDIVGSFRFDNGDFPSLGLIDCHFGAIPFSLGSRSEHMTFSLEGKCSYYKLVE